jgi:exodeoxyribonuclease V gamma subunit
MLFLHRNNRMEHLLEELGDVFSSKRPQIFRPEVIVVQSLGMERWLSMGLCRRFRIWANAEHPFPRAFIERALEAVLGPVAPERCWTREAMTFHLAALMKELPEDPSFSALRRYLRERSDAESRIELSSEIADAFDQAQIYRPEWFLDWASQSTDTVENDFRPALFRLLEARLGPHHFPQRYRELLEKLPTIDVAKVDLPSRVCLFAVAAMPPAFLRIFDAISQQLPVHWFLLTASREYLGEEFSHREFARLALKGSAAPNEQAQMQPVLASFGRMMRDLGRLIERDCVYEDAGSSEFYTSSNGSVLQTLQADLCVLGRRGASLALRPLPLREDDQSLQVHVCHGPRRELEVVKEILLDAFEKDSELKPEEVIVLLRDVEVYAPLVDAVFSAERGQPSFIPYTLADRAIGAGNGVADALRQFLDCVGRRITVTDLENLIEHNVLLRKFEIEPSSVPKIQTWLARLGARWGADVAERKREGLPEQPEHTLKFALSRLVLGASMSSETDEPFLGRMPFDVEGDDAVLAGRFVECVTTLLDTRERFTIHKTFTDWQTELATMVDSLFVVPPELSWQLTEVRTAIRATCQDAVVANFDDRVPVRTVATRLGRHFENTRSARAFLSGGVTFCAMLPMRGIPAKIVVMLGLDDGNFPRTTKGSSFDAIAREPQIGDRLVREEDRHLFLESLLAARQRFILTYVGRSARDDSPKPPSVVIEELLNVVDESFYIDTSGGENSKIETGSSTRRASERLVVLHPMHAHSPRYFDGTDRRLLQSSSYAFCAAQAVQKAKYQTKRGMLEALSPIHLEDLRLVTFERFWDCPGEALYQSRLLGRTTQIKPKVEDFDPLELAGLDRYKLSTEQFLALGSERAKLNLFSRWKASGQSPAGNLGSLAFDENYDRVRTVGAVVNWLACGKTQRTVLLSLRLGNVKLMGYVGELYGDKRIDWGVSSLKPKFRLRAWIRHLTLCAAGYPVDTFLLRPNSIQSKPPHLERWSPIEGVHAQGDLERLVELYLTGMTAPLPFFPGLSYEYVLRQRKGEDGPVTISRLERAYSDSLEGEDSFTTPEVGKEVSRLFGDVSPISNDWAKYQGLEQIPNFAQLSEDVWGPSFDSKVELSKEEESVLKRFASRVDAVSEESR